MPYKQETWSWPMVVNVTINGYPQEPYKLTVTGGDSLRTGTSGPNWRYLIRAGLDATTELEGVRFIRGRMIPGFYAYYQESNGLSSIVAGDFPQNITSFNDIIPSGNTSPIADAQASSRFLASYIRVTNSFRGANFLAEVRETYELLRHPVESFYKRTWSFAGKVRRLRKVYKLDPIKYRKSLSNAWLAYQFGVKPLVSDINDATKLLNELHSSTRHDSRTVTGSGEHRDWIEENGGQGSLKYRGEPGYLGYYAQTRIDSTVRYKAVIIVRPSTSSLLKECGLNEYDILPAVWEAIPWSFLVDYFANVGEMLDAARLANLNAGHIVKTVRNSKLKIVTATNNGPTIPDPNVTYSTLSGGVCRHRGVYVHRTPSGVPYPGLHFQIPGLGSVKWLNIAALTTQILSSSPTPRHSI